MNDVATHAQILVEKHERRRSRIPGGSKAVVVDARATRSIRYVASCASTPRNAGLPPVASRPPLARQLASFLFLPLPLPFARCAARLHPLKKERRRKRSFSLFLSSPLSSIPERELERKYSAAQQDFSKPGNNKYIYISKRKRVDFNVKFMGHRERFSVREETKVSRWYSCLL